MRFINQNSSKTASKVDIPLRSVLANAHTKSHYSTCKWTIVCISNTFFEEKSDLLSNVKYQTYVVEAVGY